MPITPTMRRQRSEWDGRSRNSTSRGSRNQVPPEDLQGYLKVKSALRIPIAGGEAEFTRWGFRPILVDRAIDILHRTPPLRGTTTATGPPESVSPSRRGCGPLARGAVS